MGNNFNTKNELLKDFKTKDINSAKFYNFKEISFTINHEINNPLTGVLGNVELLLLNDSLDKTTLSKLEEIRELSLRIRDVVKNITELMMPPPKNVL